MQAFLFLLEKLECKTVGSFLWAKFFVFKITNIGLVFNLTMTSYVLQFFKYKRIVEKNLGNLFFYLVLIELLIFKEVGFSYGKKLFKDLSRHSCIFILLLRTFYLLSACKADFLHVCLLLLLEVGFL